MKSARFVVSCSHQGVVLKPQHFASEEQAREHAGYMEKVADRVALSALPRGDIVLAVSTGARVQARKSGEHAKEAAEHRKSLKQAKNFVVLLVENDSETFEMLTRIADSGGEFVVLSARSFWAAASWIKAAPRIDLLISAADLSSELGGVDVADLAAESHPGVDVLLLSYRQEHTATGLPSRYRSLRKPVGAEEIAHFVDTAYLSFLQTRVVNR